MDFVAGLTHTHTQNDLIWVVVDKMTKSMHLLLFKTSDFVDDYAKTYIWELVKLYSVPLSIILDQETQSVLYVYKTFQKGLGIRIKLNITFHPQNDEKAERIIQT